MNYEGITQVIKEVTGLEIPVYFNDVNANCNGGPYFGVGDHSWDIWEEVGMEEMDNPMFELTDFIENKHLKYYHVGLPNKIVEPGDSYIFKVTEEQLKSKGIFISLDTTLLETFIILHEFGHAHELLVAYEGNVEKYLQETTKENNHVNYQIRVYHLGGTEEGLRLHKSTSTEKYADAFAISYFQEVIHKALRQNLL